MRSNNKIKLLLPFVFICLIFNFVDIDASKIISNIEETNKPILFSSILVFIFIFYAQTLRFTYLFPYKISSIGLFQLNLASQSLNLVLPGQISSEIYKFIKLNKLSKSKELTAFTLVIDKALGFTASIGFGIGCIYFGNILFPQLYPLQFNFLYLFFVIIFIPFIPACKKHYQKITNKLNLRTWLKKVKWRGLVLMTLASAILRAARFYLLALSLNIELNIYGCFVLVALTQMSIFIPSVSGSLGVLEGILIFSLSLLNISTDEALVFSILNRLSIILIGCFGAAIFILKKKEYCGHTEKRRTL
ncbi:flippase-like domain-containing protein [Pseudoalteromonas sp. C2R02]|uniref:lysylphosphatidylglycerol synthase transmembrane domain-containing protein n=1 Tax=Pseudoalteromonas sp. C2R02 TaxID=2841565 RepID=UPI001C09AD66|nr:flippase-like domain-containing protein [Pseudoalteromonas sp. C2R02]